MAVIDQGRLIDGYISMNEAEREDRAGLYIPASKLNVVQPATFYLTKAS